MNRRDSADPRPGHVLTQDEATALGEKLLGLAQDHVAGVQIEHTAHVVTKVADGHVTGNETGNQLRVAFDTGFGRSLPVTISTDQLDDAALKQVVAQTTANVSPAADAGQGNAATEHTAFTKQEYVPVTLWHDSTAAAMDSAPAQVVPHLVEQMQTARVKGAATMALAARSQLYLYRAGLSAWVQETDSEVTVTARTLSGGGSGWAGQANRDWSAIHVPNVVQRAIHVAHESERPYPAEPQRWTVILSAEAVGQLVRLMAPLFDAEAADRGETPLALRGKSDKTNKLGLKVFDSRLTMVSDPADPKGGYAPFFEANGNGPAGRPLKRTTWVENGILKNLAYTPRYAAAHGQEASERPYSVRLEASPGTKTSTVAQMIAACKDGIYVTRFSDVLTIDRKTGLMTGVTRDGCFYVAGGKIDSPATMLRFAESPFFIFNRIRMIGATDRVALGYTPPTADELGGMASWPFRGPGNRWPRTPIIVPPMMVEDFTFTLIERIPTT